jgi:histidinol-phosphatase (PHP family)
VPADYHVHTALCHHANGTASEYRDEAVRKAIPEICFTDHVPSPDGYDPANRMDMAEFPEYRRSVEETAGSGAVKVGFGIEADYYEGAVDFLRQWLPEQSFDLVLGSVHYINDWPFDNPDARETWKSVDVRGVWKRYFELVGRLADTRLFDVVSHLDLPKKFGHRIPDHDLEELAQPALDHVAKAGMGMEINTSGLRRPCKEMYPSPLLLSLAQERGIPITFGSDAHSPRDVGYAFDLAVQAARQAGYVDCLQMRNRRKERVPLPAG